MNLWKTVKNLFHFKGSSASDRLLAELQKKIGYQFRNLDILRMSLTHRSYIRPNGCHMLPSNERIEFLGDSVLGLVVADYLYDKFPGTFEGGLTKQKSLLVNEATLFRTAASIELGNYLYISAEEERAGGRKRASINADAFEALIGAIYLDGGQSAAKSFIHRFLLPHMDKVIADKDLQNYKGELLEHIQATGTGLPRYEVTSTDGPDHEKIFTVAVYYHGQLIGTGTGPSKKDAEQKAAAQAVIHLKSGVNQLKTDGSGAQTDKAQ
jgi:ribonuclease III